MQVIERWASTMFSPRLWLPPVILTLFLIIVAQSDFLSFHTMAERFAVMISFVMFAFIWATHDYTRNNFLLFLACGYFWIGTLDLVHVLVYERMDLFTEANANLSVQFWISARYLGALLLLAAPFAATKKRDGYLLLIAFGVIAVGMVILIFSGQFPAVFVEGKGLTDFMRYSDYLIILILAFALFFLVRHPVGISKVKKVLISASIILTMCAELFFTFFASFDGLSNLTGHILKTFSYWFIFQAVVIFNLKKPFTESQRLQEYNRSLFDDSVTGMTLCKMDGTFVDVNPAFARLTGYTVDELKSGMSFWELTSEHHLESEKAIFENFVYTGNFIPYEKEYIRKDGSLIPVQITGKAINHDGETYNLASIQDITERQKHRKTTIELVFQKQALDEHAIVSISDANQNIVYVNDKFCEISGYSREELLGQNHRILKSGEHSGEFYKDMWRTIANGKPWHGEIQNRKKDGGYFWVDTTIVTFRDDKGEIVKYVSIRTDITELKDAERSIRQFKTTLDLTENEVYMFWPDTLKFFYVNQAAKDKLGWLNEEFLNMRPLDVSLKFGESEYRDMLKPLILGKQQSLTYESIHKTHDGKIQPVEINLQYQKPEGEKPRFIAIVKDITERQKVDKAKSEFLSTVSHELRTPLTSIKGVLGLIKAGVLDDSPEKLHSMIDAAYRNSERLTVLINDLLDIDKIDAGALNLVLIETNINWLVEEAIEINEGYAVEFGVTYICSHTDLPLVANVDKDLMMQVLANLFSNATKFSSRGSEVNISVGRCNNGIRIAVKDTGIGIPEAAWATLFDKFTQIDSSDQRTKGGTGLGLYIAQNIIEAHGGRMSFTSEIGKGTTFYIDLEEAFVEG